jgi:hypothetical protein
MTPTEPPFDADQVRARFGPDEVRIGMDPAEPGGDKSVSCEQDLFGFIRKAMGAGDDETLILAVNEYHELCDKFLADMDLDPDKLDLSEKDRRMVTAFNTHIQRLLMREHVLSERQFVEGLLVYKKSGIACD